MKKVTHSLFVATILGVVVRVVFAQDYAPRQDVIWARSLAGETITLDGVLDEPAWALAESLVVVYDEFDPLPTSASTIEGAGGPGEVTDPLHAVVKFLVSHDDNQFYVAFSVKDSSVLGSPRWGNWDAVLTSLKSRTASAYAEQMFPTAPWEYFLTYWRPDLPDTVNPDPGDPPYFQGYFGGADRETQPLDVEKWDAGVTVDGTSNDDGIDNGYVFEIRMALDTLGYDLNKAEGEVLEYNFSIYDCDWLYDDDPTRAYTTRTCWQNYWNSQDNVGRVYTRPDVTINSGPLPDVEPDFIIPNGSNFAEPTIDGVLDDDVWADAFARQIKFGDWDVRNAYSGVGPFRSGQWQPDLDGNAQTPLPQVLDPADAMVKIFFRDDFLYLAADVNDQLIQGTDIENARDGVRFLIGDREKIRNPGGDNRMFINRLFVSFGEDTEVDTLEELAVLSSDTVNAVEFAITLKGASTINENTDVDEGYMIEMKVDLTALGYPAGLGDHLLYVGATVFDGDSFDDPANNYGTRTWWWRHHGDEGGLPWAVMDPNVLVSVGDGPGIAIPTEIELYGNYPNPFNPTTTLSYAIPFAGDVEIRIYNVLGQQVEKMQFTKQTAGTHKVEFKPKALSSGVYFYRVEVENQASNKKLLSQTGKMLLLK